MGSHMIKVLRQGIWGSLTGGWYFDPRHSKFTNVFHLYTWLLLMCLPFILYMVPIFEETWAVGGIYITAVIVIFLGIKITNYRLHSMFDNGEIVNKKVLQPENQPDHFFVKHELDSVRRDEPTVAEAFPVAGSNEVLERRGENENDIESNKLDGRGDAAAGPLTKADLEVDVHVDSTNLKDGMKSPLKEVSQGPRKKRRKHRQRAQKSVAFDETLLSTKRRVNVDLCDSLSSASSDTGYEAPSSETDFSEDENSDSNDGESSGENDSTEEPPCRKRTRAIRRRAGIRGQAKHPWYNKPRSYKNKTRDNEQDSSSSISSDSSDRWPRMKDNNNIGIKSGINDSQPGTSKYSARKSKRKRAFEGVSVSSPDKKSTALDQEPHLKINKESSSAIAVENSPMQSNQYRDPDLELPASDQELLERDPVWTASRSSRYSADRSLFFRRRSYTVNSHRTAQRDQDSRRRVSTVPPYSRHGSFPTSRRPTSSFQKLISLWGRDPIPSLTHGDVASSPGEISPGQVVLTGHSKDNSELPDAKTDSKNIFFSLDDDATMISDVKNIDSSVRLKVPKRSRPKSESGSYNANPHCNEMPSNSAATGDSNAKNISSKDANNPETKKRRPRKQKSKRSRSARSGASGDASLKISKLDEDMRNTFGLSVADPDPFSANPRAQSHKKIKSEVEFEEDMNRFVTDLNNTRAEWQGTDSIGSTENPVDVADQKIVTTEKSNERVTPPETIDNESLGSKITGTAASSVSEPTIVTKIPRHSLPLAASMSSNVSVSGSYRRTTLPTSQPSSLLPQGRSRSTSSRRVRHPAGSHSRLTSNTSEEGGAQIQQMSANSATSTTELLANAQDEIPVGVIEKLEEKEDQTTGVHIAKEHTDTSAGATHAFQDEFGNWLTYTFGEATSGAAQMLSAATSTSRSNPIGLRQRTHSLMNSGDSSDEGRSPPPTRRERERSGNSRRSTLNFARRLNQRMGRPDHLPDFAEEYMSESYTLADSPNMSPIDFILNSGIMTARRPATPRVKLYYKFNFLPCKSIILQYDRLALLDLLDRNRFVFENIFATLLAVIVAVLGFLLLQRGFFYDVWPLWFCIVIATSQYSLVRSVQPDSASPTHGHNRVIAYSRPLYFISLALLILLFDYLSKDTTYVHDTYIYANIYFTQGACLRARTILIVLIMLLPFIFLLGMLPQINTFIMYLAEQIEIHMFGGTACTGILAAVYSLLRSIIACACLFGFCYGGMKTEEKSKHILFSVFCALLVSFSYHLSRQTNNPVYLWRLIRSKFFPDQNIGDAENGGSDNLAENPDEISSLYVQRTLSERLQFDLIVCPIIAVIMFAMHCSTLFTALQPSLSLVLYTMTGVLGFIIHYIIPQLRKQLPWLLFSSPLLKSREYSLYEVQEAAKLMWFEKVYFILGFVERNVLYPFVIMNELTRDAAVVTELYGLVWGCIILTFVGFKLLRSSYSVTLLQYTILIFSALFTRFDARNLKDSTLVTYFLVSILFVKLQDLLLKLQFIYVYIAPWQITWGSAFHAFAQPFSVPHSGMLLLHTVISSILHAPLAPFLGSAVFLTSYVRPLKFWERNYNTKRVDHSNTRLASQIDRGPSTDDNNLNSIFYEHLTLSLQKSLCGDIAMGRWGNVYPGDCFIMASDYLNALVHIIQCGNGVITFQLRGLEFSGTYCQQREVEAISEGVEDNFKCCCCRVGHAKNMLSFNAAFSQRWLAWQVQTTKFVLDGYSITDNSATSMLGVYDLRKILLSSMVKGVVYFLTSHKSLEKWLKDDAILDAIKLCEVPDYVDIDPSFSVAIHDDYDMWLSGISRTKFQAVFGGWIQCCSAKREKPLDDDENSKLITLCFMISVLSRRALGTASSHLTASHIVLESFLYGLHSLFKGDFRITSPKDEWVFNDMDLLHHVVAPGVRMSLKLHLDHFQNADDENDLEALYDNITENISDMVITHEADPEWRKAVLSNRTNLLALRHVAGDAVDSYFVITLRKRSQGFRVVRVNKECVKGLWAGQQQELVFLRNSNPERGSIQNAKQVLRNMINSSCDQPIGYPIYVSPITTSFSNSHEQQSSMKVGSINLQCIRSCFSRMWDCILRSCGGGCNSGGSAGIHIGADITARIGNQITAPAQPQPVQSVRSSVTGSQSSSVQSNSGNQTIVPTSTNQDTNEPVPVSRMFHRGTHHVHRLPSAEQRRTARPEDYVSGNVFTSSTSLTGVRSSTRWRTGPEGVKIFGRHSSGTGSIEMTTINPKLLLPPSVGGKNSRNSRKEGSESSAINENVILKTPRSSLPSEESQMGRLSITSASGGRRVHKSGSHTTSSSSSSISRGDSLNVVGIQISKNAKSAKKSSTDSHKKKTKRQNHVKENQTEIVENKKEIVVITDPTRVFETLEVHRQIDFVKWPNDEWRKHGGRSKWGDWRPKKGMSGEVVFRWYPNHMNSALRSHIGEIIVLMQIEESNLKKTFYVPIPEKCIRAFDHDVDVETTHL